MSIDQETIEDAVLTLTGAPEWKAIQEGLFREMQQSHANVFHQPTWEAVCEEKGFVRGLYYCLALREQVIAAQKQREDSANL